MNRPSRILLIQLRWMGDVVVTTPAIRLLRQQFPDARIDYLTDAKCAVMLEGNPYIDEVITWHRGVRADFNLFRKLRSAHYDAVVDFRVEHWRTAVQTFATGAPLRVGLRNSKLRTPLYSTRLARNDKDGYVALQKMLMLEPLGVDVAAKPDLHLDLAVPESARTWASAFFDRAGVHDGDRIVVVTPTSRYYYKRWSPDRWVDVIDSLAQNGARVVLTYGPGEREQAQDVVDRVRTNVIWEPEGTTVPQLMGILERCDFWVGNDGGAKHIAVALDKPTISVDRYTNAAVWTDPTPGSMHSGVEAVPILPCNFVCAQCAHVSCLEQIAVSAVTTPALALLTSRLSSTMPRALP